ncbi:MAG TPA: PHP domain-containing protein [Syntrophaceae bacterium]|nr:PHP domain-containing protein [Syntrophaceae bacterium]
MDLVDLHTHSTVSDGTLTPRALIQYAKEKGLKAVALTDHDNIDGNQQAIEEGRRVGIEVIPGIEISGEWPYGTLHILGYYITKKDRLKNHLSQLQRVREQRNFKIIEKLKQSGIPITLKEVQHEAGGTQIGRPHIAQVLVKKGVAKDLDQAFHRFLKKGGAAYVDKFRPSPEQAMEWILEAGGVPVLAHPFTLNIKESKDLEILIAQWRRFGLKGIEVYYPEHTPLQEQMYQNLAQRLELIITGGSDFHGLNKPGVHLGTGYGNMKVPYTCVENLKSCWRRIEKGGNE